MTDAQKAIIALLEQIKAATGGGGGAPSFAEITGDPSENANLASALLLKQTAAQVQALIDASAPYLVYTALLTQASTDAPVAVVMPGNTLGAIVWSYSNVGEYAATLVGAFTSAKTTVDIGGVRGSAKAILINNDICTIQTRDGADSSNDGLLTDTFCEIRVYP